MGKPLTSELVLLRSKCDSLFTVKNLNLWGNEIDDVKLLRQMPNVEVLSLSLNKISSLKEFANCSKLQELYLRKNSIFDLSEVKYLTNLQNLKILWLLDNPCSEVDSYREIVIKILPNLTKLDNTVITGEEKNNAMKREIKFEEEEVPKSKGGLPLSEKRGGFNENFNFESQPQSVTNHNNKMTRKEMPFKKESIQEYRRETVPTEANINSSPKNIGKNENILCAVLALLKELDENSLELVKRDIERKMNRLN